MAELNQLEGIQHLENQLNKMGSVRDVALANQNAEKMAQKIRVSHQSRKNELPLQYTLHIFSY